MFYADWSLKSRNLPFGYGYNQLISRWTGFYSGQNIGLEMSFGVSFYIPPIKPKEYESFFRLLRSYNFSVHKRRILRSLGLHYNAMVPDFRNLSLLVGQNSVVINVTNRWILAAVFLNKNACTLDFYHLLSRQYTINTPVMLLRILNYNKTNFSSIINAHVSSIITICKTKKNSD